MPWCDKHQEEKVLYKTSYKCRSCNKEYQAKWFANNKDLQRTRVQKTPSYLNKQLKPKIKPTGKICDFLSCERKVVSKGHCDTHARQIRENKPLTIINKRIPTNGICSIKDCEFDIHQIGLCKKHYRQQVRYKRRTVEGDATAAQISQRFQMFGNKCWICHNKADILVIEHVKPINVGGSNWPSNIRPACFSCNSIKGAKWWGINELSNLVKWILDSK